jgi:hypothetical protein
MNTEGTSHEQSRPVGGRLADTWRRVAAAGEEIHVLSLLAFAMTFLLLRTGMADPIGIVALALQAGLLIRINDLYGQSAG